MASERILGQGLSPVSSEITRPMRALAACFSPFSSFYFSPMLSFSLFFALTPRTLFTVISLPRTFVASRRRHIVRLCMKSPLTFVSRAATKKSIHERSHAYSSNISNGLLLILKLDGPLIKLHCYTAVEQKAACLRVRLHAVSPSLYKVHRGKDYLAMRY